MTLFGVSRNERKVGAMRRLFFITTALVLACNAVAPNSWVTAAKAVTSPPLTLCGNQVAPGTTPPPIQHVIVVMMENFSYSKVVGSVNAPYQTNTLAAQCGLGTSAFGATHTSAANYLALSAGEFPSTSPPGCGTVSACADTSDNLYNQIDHAPATANLSWKAYMESMPSACAVKSASPYKNGHNPVIFYPSTISSAECQAKDVGVPDLTAQSGAFWNDLNGGTLPSFAWVTPNQNNDGEGPGTAPAPEKAADTWLSKFIGTVQGSASYQAGNTAVIVTYDEGAASDPGVTNQQGEDCTDQSQALPIVNNISAHRESCHVPFFVVYPYTQAGADSTFFDHYSVTKTVEQLFGLPCLAHACDVGGPGDPNHITNSLVGHFGLQLPTTTPPPPADTTAPTVPQNVNAVSAGPDKITLTWDASTDDSGTVAGYKITRGDGSLAGTTTGATNFTDTGLAANTSYSYNVSAYDGAGNYSAMSMAASATTDPAPVLVPPQAITDLAATATSSQVTLTWTAPAIGSAPLASYTISRSGAAPVTIPATNSTYVDDTVAPSTPYDYTVTATDTNGLSGGPSNTASVTTQAAAPPVTACVAPVNTTELSANLSLETSMTGWTGVYNSTSLVTRVQPTSGSYDGNYALQISPKVGYTGAAGVNNAAPIWVTSSVSGTTYTGSAMVKASVAGEQVSLMVRETTPGGSGVSFHTTTVTLNDTAWHAISSVYTAQNSGNYIRYSLYGNNFANSGQYFLADCLSLQVPSGS